MKDEIVKKITTLLSENTSLVRESDIVYLFVEIRKLLDRENNYNFPTLRFYCDWAVHTKKSKITKEVKKIMEKIYEEMKARDAILDNPADKKSGIVSRIDSADFIYMKELKKEMQNFLKSKNINCNLSEYKNWTEFTESFINVLADQEIENPCHEIKYFKFAKNDLGNLCYEICYMKQEASYKKYRDCSFIKNL